VEISPHKYDREPYEVRKAAENLKNNKYADLTRNKNHEFVPLVAELLGGLGKAAVTWWAWKGSYQALCRNS
jgi:hypothetical protein